jgi:REG-2-like HAD superfamily hydrolase
MALRALLLDFGGTLATEVPSRGELYARSARARGVDVTAERMAARMAAVHRDMPREWAGRPRYADPWFEEFIQRVFHGELGVAAAELPSVTRELFARFSDAASFRLFPGALDLLRAARGRSLRTAVVSNWSEHLEELLTNLGLRALLDVVLSSAVEGLEKPDPALFVRALEALGVGAGEALHAGNEPELDVAGARAAGIEAVLVAPSGKMGAPGALRTLRELHELVLARTLLFLPEPPA